MKSFVVFLLFCLFVGSVGLSIHFHSRSKRIGAEMARTSVDLFILDDFSQGQRHGDSVHAAAQRDVFGRCWLHSVNVSADTGLCLSKGLAHVLEYKEKHPDARILINLSFGSYAPDLVEFLGLLALLDEHTLIVAASGNDATDRPMYPAAYPGVVSVAAVNEQGVRKEYSNYGTHVDLAAVPDEYVSEVRHVKTEIKGQQVVHRYVYRIEGGTSLSAPRVSAAAASVWSLSPHLTPDEILGVLRDTGVPTNPGLGGRMLSIPRLQAATLPAKIDFEERKRWSVLAASVTGLTLFLFAVLWPGKSETISMYPPDDLGGDPFGDLGGR